MVTQPHMNRADRRKAKKDQRKKGAPRQGHMVVNDFTALLYTSKINEINERNNQDELDVSKLSDFRLRYLRAIEQLKKYELDPEQFNLLMDYCVFTLFLGKDIYEQIKDETILDVLWESSEDNHQAIYTLTAIKEKWEEANGKATFFATESQIAHLMAAAHWSEQFFNISTGGMVIRAMQEAVKFIRGLGIKDQNLRSELKRLLSNKDKVFGKAGDVLYDVTQVAVMDVIAEDIILQQELAEKQNGQPV